MNLKVNETFHSFTHLNFASASSISINEIHLFTLRLMYFRIKLTLTIFKSAP